MNTPGKYRKRTMIRTIEFFLFDGTLGLDITGPLEVFSTASDLLKKQGCARKAYLPVFSAAKRGMVTLSSGLKLKAEIELGKCEPPDILLIPGGLGVDRVTQTTGLLRRIKKEAGRARRVVSVCNGAFILAACGMLKGKRATTHWIVAEELSRQYPDTTVVPDAIYVRDKKIATSAGVTAGIDLALALVEEDHGPALAMEVARMLVLYLRRSGGQSQFSAPLDLQTLAGKRFSDLHDWMMENLREPLSVEHLADRAGMSPRNFSRIFASETGMSPGRYVESIRLNLARELLESGDDTLDIVADKCGFGREERLRRVFLRRFSVTPIEYRNHFRREQH